MENVEVMAQLNLKNIIAEVKEVAQALNDYIENLEQIDEKYTVSCRKISEE